MLKWIKRAGAAAAVLLTTACFMPWYHIPLPELTISGMEAGDKLGKPALLHFVLTALYLVFLFTPRIWAKQWNLLVSALNMAWMVRNFFGLAVCSAGVCPERLYGIWLVLAASVVMLLAALFPDMRVPARRND